MQRFARCGITEASNLLMSRRSVGSAAGFILLKLAFRPTAAFAEQTASNSGGFIERSGPELAADADPRRLIPHEQPPWDSYVVSDSTLCKEFIVSERMQGYTVLRMREFRLDQPTKVDLSYLAFTASGLLPLAIWGKPRVVGTRIHAAQGVFFPITEDSTLETLEERMIRNDGPDDNDYTIEYIATIYEGGKPTASHSALPWAKGPFSIIYMRRVGLMSSGSSEQSEFIYSHTMRWVIGEDVPGMRVEGLSVNGKPFGKTFEGIQQAAVAGRRAQ